MHNKKLTSAGLLVCMVKKWKSSKGIGYGVGWPRTLLTASCCFCVNVDTSVDITLLVAGAASSLLTLVSAVVLGAV